jgi:hypothetical protein
MADPNGSREHKQAILDCIQERLPVIVRGGDYTYEGVPVAIFYKLTGAPRVVVEDINGRLFIHNPGQIEVKP